MLFDVTLSLFETEAPTDIQALAPLGGVGQGGKTRPNSREVRRGFHSGSAGGVTNLGMLQHVRILVIFIRLGNRLGV